jgi:hypothetical protein
MNSGGTKQSRIVTQWSDFANNPAFGVKLREMKALLTGSVLLLMASASAAGQPGKVTSQKFLVRVVDAKLLTRAAAGPINMRNCLVVLPDGRMELELFRQEFFGSADVKSYNGRLNDRELQILLSKLNDTSIQNLSQFVPPKPALRGDEFHTFIVDISSAGSLRSVGFFEWRGQGPTNGDEQKRIWARDKVVLQPLLEWSQWAKSDRHTSHWVRVHDIPASCSSEPDE